MRQHYNPPAWFILGPLLLFVAAMFALCHADRLQPDPWPGPGTTTPTPQIGILSTSGTYQIGGLARDSWDNGSTNNPTAKAAYAGQGTATEYTTGLQFTGMGLTQGATFYSATVQVYVTATTGTSAWRIYGGDYDSCTNFTSDLPSAKTKTTAYVNWTPAAGTGWKTSPELKTILQEITDRPGFTTNGAVCLIIVDNQSTDNQFQIIDTYDHSTTNAAKLTISWDSATTPTPTPTATATATPTPANLVTNGGFETTDTPPADFAGWYCVTGAGGSITADTTTKHSGAQSAKLTMAASETTYCLQWVDVSAGQTYNVSIWTRGDGANAGDYYVYPDTFAFMILPVTSTGIPGTTWTQVTYSFTTDAGYNGIYLYYRIGTPGGSAYFDDVTMTVETGPTATPTATPTTTNTPTATPADTPTVTPTPTATPCGQIYDNRTWSGTQAINCNTTVLHGQTLTITAGTVVTFTGAYLFDVRGTLLVQGTLTNPVTFSAPTPAAGQYGPIIVEPSAEAHIEYATFTRGKSIDVDGPTWMTNTTVTTNTIGLHYLYPGSLTLGTITYNGTGILTQLNVNPTITQTNVGTNTLAIDNRQALTLTIPSLYYYTTDTAAIAAKITDQADDYRLGPVIWLPMATSPY